MSGLSNFHKQMLTCKLKQPLVVRVRQGLIRATITLLFVGAVVASCTLPVPQPV
jgi:hypothetical protein